jgi:bifunctional pyridoxal-dependent enzyme with beta-cystathionase and maltose regulon repressor activities
MKFMCNQGYYCINNSMVILVTKIILGMMVHALLIVKHEKNLIILPSFHKFKLNM